MKRHLLVLTALFACVFLGNSTTVAQEDCWKIEGTWTCSDYYTGEPDLDCSQHLDICSPPDEMGISECQIPSLVTYKKAANYAAVHNLIVPDNIYTGHPLSTSASTWITCVELHACDTECEPIFGFGNRCKGSFSFPFGGFNYLLENGPCATMMMP
jgi:hypothetical protein